MTSLFEFLAMIRPARATLAAVLGAGCLIIMGEIDRLIASSLGGNQSILICWQNVWLVVATELETQMNRFPGSLYGRITKYGHGETNASHSGPQVFLVLYYSVYIDLIQEE